MINKSDILFEDNEIIVIHKKAGVAVESNKIGTPDLISMLKTYISRNQRAARIRSNTPVNVYMIHRLDQVVEGVIVFAKTKEAAANLSRQLTNEGFQKYYYAAVCGAPSKNVSHLNIVKNDNGFIQIEDKLIKTDNKSIIDNENANDKIGKKAILEYIEIARDCSIENVNYKAPSLDMQSNEKSEYLAKLKEKQNAIEEKNKSSLVTLLKIHLKTGRFHQIRAQLSHMDCPILGDVKYGAPEKRRGEIALCSYKLSFTHPKTGEKMDFKIKPVSSLFAPFDAFLSIDN